MVGCGMVGTVGWGPLGRKRNGAFQRRSKPPNHQSTNPPIHQSTNPLIHHPTTPPSDLLREPVHCLDQENVRWPLAEDRADVAARVEAEHLLDAVALLLPDEEEGRART